MKKTFLKIGCLLIAIIMVLSALVSCNIFSDKQKDDATSADTEAPTDTSNTGSTTDSDTEAPAPDDSEEDNTPREDKVAIRLGTAYANILYSADRDDTLKAATSSFASDYAKVIGVSKVTPTKAGTYDDDKAEILVGNIKYPECEGIYKDLTYDKVKVCVVGSKLVIAGYNTALMAEVLGDLADLLAAKKDADGNIILEKDFVIEKTFGEPLAALPILDGVKPSFVDTGDNCYMVNFGATNNTTFTKYCDAIAATGFTLYSEKTMDKNIYKTYVNDTYVVTAIYTNHNSYTKALIEPLSGTVLPTKAADNSYTPVSGVETTITQLGLYDGNLGRTYNGMCYVVRLADGSFIVVDGGFSGEGCEDRIYNTLKKQAPDPDNIVIAAWIITHAHSDHTGVLKSFFTAYADKVTVEQFICNLPSVAQLVNNWENEREGNERSTTNMRDFLYNTLSSIPKVKAHPGQEFYIRNAKINVIYTIDLYERKLDDYNNTSIVFKLEAEDTSMLFLADYDDKGRTMNELYRASTLKSDIVQMAHHGLPENSSNAITSVIKPTYVFWPAGAQVVKKGTTQYPDGLDLFTVEQNQWVLNNCEGNIYLAEDNVYVFNMKDRTVEKYETVAEYLAS